MSTTFELLHFTTGFLPNPGEIITYFLGVSNTSASSINSVTITSNLGLSFFSFTFSDPSLGLDFNIGDANQNGVIDRDETWFYAADYFVTQLDISNNGAADGLADGALTNTVKVTASGPAGSAMRLSTESAPLDAEKPAITLSQTASPNPARAGELINVELSVRNSGNVSFAALNLSGGALGKPVAITAAGGNNIGDLDADGCFDVGETWRYTTTYPVTQADIDNRGALDGSADGVLTQTVKAKALVAGEGSSSFAEASVSSVVNLGGSGPSLAGVQLVKTARLDACRCDDDCLSGLFGVGNDTNPSQPGIQASPGINLGDLTNHLFVFANGSVDANWQGATKGFAGDVVVDGLQARERTSGAVPFAGTIYTNDSTGGAWQSIVSSNAGQAAVKTGQSALVNGLEQDLVAAIKGINALQATPTASFGGRSFNFANLSSAALNGLNTSDGIGQTFVINVTSGLQVSTKLNITGDASDVFVLRWDSDANPSNGYQGQVKFQSGGGIVPLGGLKLGNFIHVAGDINASGGGSNPAAPFPQAPVGEDGKRIVGGANFNGGGFFSGYWLTTGAPTRSPDPVTGLFLGETSSLSNAIFAGGWYTLTSRFSMTSGTSGVHDCPDPGLITPVDPRQQTDETFDPGNIGNDGGVLSGGAKDLITYTFRVSNSGQIALASPNLLDNNATPADPSDDYAPTPVLKANARNFGDLNNNNLIDIGESWYYQSKRYLGSGPATLTNTATVVASPLGSGGSVSGSDSAIVQILA